MRTRRTYQNTTRKHVTLFRCNYCVAMLFFTTAAIVRTSIRNPVNCGPRGLVSSGRTDRLVMVAHCTGDGHPSGSPELHGLDSGRAAGIILLMQAWRYTRCNAVRRGGGWRARARSYAHRLLLDRSANSRFFPFFFSLLYRYAIFSPSSRTRINLCLQIYTYARVASLSPSPPSGFLI